MQFEEFWLSYPRKIAKKVAHKSWNRLTEEQQKLALEGLERYKKYLLAMGTGQEYILHAATYLNQERWTDELEMPANKPEQTQWWKSEAATLAMAQQVGVIPRAAEDWESLRARIRASLIRAA
jgi:hypothetical protein